MDSPVDRVYSEKQMRLLTRPLYSSWSGPGGNRRFLAMANVGLFFGLYEPPPRTYLGHLIRPLLPRRLARRIDVQSSSAEPGCSQIPVAVAETPTATGFAG